MAKRRMIGKIAREDSLAIHSYKSNGTLALFFSLVVQNEARLPCALRCVRCMAATRQWKREPECHEISICDQLFACVALSSNLGS